MSTSGEISLDPMAIVRDLAALPHRGATTDQERHAADVLTGYLTQLGASVERQFFITPKTYISEVWSLVGGLILGLALLPALSWLAFVWISACVALALQYFDWRASPVSLFPPRGQAQNVIGTQRASGAPSVRLILMGHYDSAPVSMLYLPSSVKNFRQSLRLSIGLMLLAVGVALCSVLRLGQPVITWLRYVLILYFTAQGAMSSIDYLRLGHTNGAADNATGAAIAMATAARLWRSPIPGWQVDVVLTSAEEANMKGALAYYRAHKTELTSQRTFVLNFDNLGAGTLKVITRTGGLTDVVYDNALVKAALQTASTDARFSDVQPGVWHTGDFDSIWFCRAGIPSLTLSAQDAQGLIPNLHRPSDTLENVDVKLPGHAVDFAEATVQRLSAEIHPI